MKESLYDLAAIRELNHLNCNNQQHIEWASFTHHILPPSLESLAGLWSRLVGVGLSNGRASVRIGLGVTCDMDPVQLALTSALLWLAKTAAAEDRERDEEAGSSRDVQDPLGLKQSVFIATPIVMVRKQPPKHDDTSELGMAQSKTYI